MSSLSLFEVIIADIPMTPPTSFEQNETINNIGIDELAFNLYQISVLV